MNTEVMFSSKSDNWETPQLLFKELAVEFGFTLDVAASHETAKCEVYYTKTGGFVKSRDVSGKFDARDGLEAPWTGYTCWMNPPYGREVGKWVAKASQEAEQEAVVVALLPARTDTRWFHDYIYKKHDIRFLKGRLKFGQATNSAPFPSMIVVFA